MAFEPPRPFRLRQDYIGNFLARKSVYVSIRYEIPTLRWDCDEYAESTSLSGLPNDDICTNPANLAGRMTYPLIVKGI